MTKPGEVRQTPPVKAGGNKSEIGYWIHSLVGVALIFGFGTIPPIDPITPLGMRVVGIFLGMIYLWSFVTILWPSLLGIIALGLSGYAPMNKVILSAFGDRVPVLVFFCHDSVRSYPGWWHYPSYQPVVSHSQNDQWAASNF